MNANVTIRMKPCDDNNVNDYQITVSGVDVDQIKKEIIDIMSSPENDILSIYDVEEELKKQGYENDYITGEVILTIYEYDYSCVLRVQEEKFIYPENFGVGHYSEEDVFTEFVTTEFVRIFNSE